MVSCKNCNEWQPIETAPKDGTGFLATHTRGKSVEPYVCSWGVCLRREDGYIAHGGREWWRSFRGTHLAPTPTHWMPLPAPPNA
jgi:hypothetical protein